MLGRGRQKAAQWWRRLRGEAGEPPTVVQAGQTADEQAAASVRALLEDASIPAPVRSSLAGEFARLEAMLQRLEEGQLHIAVFGRVSVGKSALGNALLGEAAFPVGVLHGTTTHAGQQAWREFAGSGVHLIDTPGIDELDGEERERIAFEAAGIADLVLFVVDGDLTSREHEALEMLARTERPLLLVLNKADRYSDAERERLLDSLRARTRGLVQPEDVVAVTAQPAALRQVQIDAGGRESEREIPREPDLAALQERLRLIIEREGRTLVALNTGLFAGRVSDQVARRIAEARRELATRVIRQYCIAKALAVAANPIPVADLLAAGALDAALVMHLGRVYGLPLTRREAGNLIAVIFAQLAALMGAVWGVNLAAAALKGLSAGLSTLVTATAQGVLAWYATEIVGRAAEKYLVAGKSWGPQGPKRAVQDLVESLDRDSILREARSEILRRLRA